MMARNTALYRQCQLAAYQSQNYECLQLLVHHGCILKATVAAMRQKQQIKVMAGIAQKRIQGQGMSIHIARQAPTPGKEITRKSALLGVRTPCTA